MEFASYEGALTDLKCDLLALGVQANGDWSTQGPAAALNNALDGLLATVAAEEEFEGKDGQQIQLHTHGRIGAQRLLVVGLGQDNDNAGRTLAARAARVARKQRLQHMALVAPANDDGARWLILGAKLGHYSFDRLKTQDVKEAKLAKVTLVNANGSSADLERASVLADAIMFARDIVNEPPINIKPETLANHAIDIAQANGLECIIYDKAALEAKGMNLILAVSAGSSEEPRLIHLTYRPEGATADTPQIALVGKGLTFDAGGLCLKPYGSIEDMKMDMAGGAAVLGAMMTISTVKPGVIVHAIIPSSENLPGASAYKPGDVISGYAGKSVEVLNTDAEGRLILADALHYANEQGVCEIVDCATLTGAICVALGLETAGIFGNNDDLIAEIGASAKDAGETVWHMPLDHRLKKHLKSDIADMRNVGKRWGGAIIAALFLEEFVGDTHWVHIDLAGPAMGEKPNDHMPKGGTGFGVATLVEYISRAAKRLQ
jgi:leucyl aminopeptidase